MASESNPTGLLQQVKTIFATCFSTLETRGELFILEMEEEKTRFIELLIWAMAVGFLGMMFLALLTMGIIILCPPGWRIYAVGGFCLLYLAGTILALLNLKALLKNGPRPFSGSINEMKKDRVWLDSSQ